MKQLNIAVLGATGLVGEHLIKILEQRTFPVNKLFPLASKNSLSKTVIFRGENIPVMDAATFDFSQAEVGLFSAGGAVSADYAPIAAQAGCLVIDNTSQFRYEEDVPLVIPEVNAHALKDAFVRGIIANPNCSTIQMLVALKPLYDRVGIKRINVATYQAVSGTGKCAVEELKQQIKAWLENKTLQAEVYLQPIAFNAIPHIDSFQDNGYTREEMKMCWETQKILEDDQILVNATTVRVPVLNGHSEVVNIETQDKITAEEARQLLNAAPGVVVMDDRELAQYPTASQHADGNDSVYVGRIREDYSHPRGLNLWIVADNLRKGAALNAVQIAELMIEQL